MIRVFRTRRLLCGSDRWIASGGLVVVGGRIERVLGSARAVVRAAAREGGAPVDLGDTLVTPGLVNAHAHLELSALVGEVEPGPSMTAWIQRVLAEGAKLSPARRQRAATSAAEGLVASGTTSVGDVDATGTYAHVPARRAPRRVVFREALDAGVDERRRQVLDGLRRALPRRTLTLEGLSPHGPHTASPALLAALARLAARRRLPVQVHWSETEDEVRWLLRGEGPFAALLGPSPRSSGLDLLERAGLLDERTSLVHGNLPACGEPARIARAGATVVHCPGSHAFFERPPFPVAAYARAGVTLALGTDSLASNAALDLRREMALFSQEHPGVSAARIWDMATRGGARALGLLVGELRPGALADLCAFEVEASGLGAALEELTAGRPAVRDVFVAGRRRSRGG